MIHSSVNINISTGDGVPHETALAGLMTPTLRTLAVEELSRLIVRYERFFYVLDLV